MLTLLLFMLFKVASNHDVDVFTLELFGNPVGVDTKGGIALTKHQHLIIRHQPLIIGSKSYLCFLMNPCHCNLHDIFCQQPYVLHVLICPFGLFVFFMQHSCQGGGKILSLFSFRYELV